MGRLIPAAFYRIGEKRREHTYPGDWYIEGADPEKAEEMTRNKLKEIREKDPENLEGLALLRELEMGLTE